LPPPSGVDDRAGGPHLGRWPVPDAERDLPREGGTGRSRPAASLRPRRDARPVRSDVSGPRRLCRPGGARRQRGQA